MIRKTASIVRRAANRLARAVLRRPRPTILMYHRIATDAFDPWGLAVPANRFAEQLDWISRHRTPLPLVEFAERWKHQDLPADAISITFDDGYACAAQAAAPLLEGYGVPATIFISPELVSKNREFWWDDLARVIMSFAGKGFLVNERMVTVPAADPHDPTWLPGKRARTPRQKLFESVWKSLRSLPAANIADAISVIRQQSPASEEPRESHRPLSVAEMRALRSVRIDFGSHAMTHPSLPMLGSIEKAEEIRGSVGACAALTGKKPRAFAYPYGDLDLESIRLVEDAGFSCACATGNSFVNSGSDLFALPRIHVGNWERRRFEIGLGGA